MFMKKNYKKLIEEIKKIGLDAFYDETKDGEKVISDEVGIALNINSVTFMAIWDINY